MAIGCHHNHIIHVLQIIRELNEAFMDSALEAEARRSIHLPLGLPLLHLQRPRSSRLPHPLCLRLHRVLSLLSLPLLHEKHLSRSHFAGALREAAEVHHETVEAFQGDGGVVREAAGVAHTVEVAPRAGTEKTGQGTHAPLGSHLQWRVAQLSQVVVVVEEEEEATLRAARFR